MSKAEVEKATLTTDDPRDRGPWADPALVKLRNWDPVWAEQCFKMSTNPWTNGILPKKTLELIALALNMAATNLNPGGTRRHVRSALAVGATREEILTVLKISTVMSIHSCSLGASILMEEATMADLDILRSKPASTPACDSMKAAGQWSEAWNPFFNFAPMWTEELMATSIGVYQSGVLPAKEIELISIALDASYSRMFAFGTRRHIKNALKAGATVLEIMEVLKLCVAQGVQGCNLAVPILAEETGEAQATAI